jgi:hypothetical protein
MCSAVPSKTATVNAYGRTVADGPRLEIAAGTRFGRTIAQQG